MKLSKKDFDLLYKLIELKQPTTFDYEELKEDDRYVLRVSNLDYEKLVFRIEFIDKLLEKDIINILIDYDKHKLDKCIKHIINKINRKKV